jgi:pimeloyl-ACP methyl ester carboxylesterase
MRIVYLHGFASSPSSTKARFFSERFAARGVRVDIPDLAAGDFEHLTISGQLAVIHESCRGEKLSLIGSSMGGYLAALYAARHPEIQKLVLMAPAFCFSARLEETFGVEKIADWRRTCVLPIYHYGYGGMRGLSYGILEDGRQYEDFPDVRQPALIFHGTQDTVVPSNLSEQFASRHPNVVLRLYPSDHELTDVLEPMWAEASSFLLS